MPLRRRRPFEALDLYEYKGIYFHTLFETIDGIQQATATDGELTLTANQIVFSSGTVTNGYLRSYFERRQQVICNALSWDRKRRFKTKIRTMSNSDQLGYVTCGWTYEGADTNRHFGFKILNNQVFGSCADGTVQSLTAALKTLGVIEELVLEAVLIPGVRVDFLIDGVLLGTLTTNLPTGTTGASRTLSVFIKGTAAVLPTRQFDMGEWFFLQEP